MFSAPGLPVHDPAVEAKVIPMAKAIQGFTDEAIAIAWLRTEFDREEVERHGKEAFRREQKRIEALRLARAL